MAEQGRISVSSSTDDSGGFDGLESIAIAPAGMQSCKVMSMSWYAACNRIATPSDSCSICGIFQLTQLSGVLQDMCGIL